MTALSLDRVSHTFDGRAAVDGLTVLVAHGEVVAMVGLNGAGKTTALRVLTGRLRPRSGTAGVLGQDPTRLDPDAARQFGQVVGAPLSWRDLTVAENVAAAARLHGMARAAAASAALETVERLELGRWSDAPARTLSLGNAQRLGIACAVVHEPRALVLDEPTSALDPRGVVIVRGIVRELADAGTGVLVSSHHLDEVARVADRIVVLHDGRPIGELDPGGDELERRFFDMVLAADTAEVGR